MNWRDLLPNPQRQALCIIRTAAWLVPQATRADWRREWTAELHFASHLIRQRGETGAKLVQFARGAFHDAAWHRMRDWNREKIERTVSRRAQSAGFCLAALAGFILLIALASGALPETRAVLLPLPYADPSRIATVTQGGATLATRTGVHRQWVRWWHADSRLIDDAATYEWTEQTVDRVRTLRGKVSENFFSLLGVQTNALTNCDRCALLSYNFFRENYGGRTPAEVRIDGQPYRVAGVLDRRFWFLTRRIGVWIVEGKSENQNAKTGVVLRLRPDVSNKQVETELESIVQQHGINPWSSFVAISPLNTRVRSVFGSFGLALLLAIGTILPAMRLNFAPDLITWRGFARGIFFCAKALLLLIAVLLAGLEFTRAASITMLGGTDLATEPLSTWLFLLGCMGALSWSIYDQRRRCRVCLRRYALAAQIGCPGCILLSWSGTELVCLEGHGTLHVSDPVTSWQDQDRWKSLDDSVLELFAQK